MHEIDPGRDVQELYREMRGTARAKRHVGELARISFRKPHELFDQVERCAGMRHEPNELSDRMTIGRSALRPRLRSACATAPTRRRSAPQDSMNLPHATGSANASAFGVSAAKPLEPLTDAAIVAAQPIGGAQNEGTVAKIGADRTCRR